MSTILILDDQATNRSILARLARKIEKDAQVVALEGPTAALDWLDSEEQIPDLVVSDFNMPDMNGAEFVRTFRRMEDCADVPVIVVTAYEDRELLYEALEAGATDFLLSPVDHREFATRARNLLTLRRQRNLRLAAERANAAKTEFLANMSHELRTPLNAIIGFAEMMQNETMGPIGTPKYREYANDIAESANHLRDVIQRMLDISRIEQGRMDLQLAPVPVSDVLARAVGIVASEADAKQIDLTVDEPPDIIKVPADQAKLEQVFANLLSNAIKFTPECGRISVKLHPGVDEVVVAITDTGIGMSDPEVRIAVTRFGQVSGDAYSKRFQGVGLGLPLAIGLVELHGGAIDIASTPEKGTTVNVRLPRERVVLRNTA